MKRNIMTSVTRNPYALACAVRQKARTFFGGTRGGSGACGVGGWGVGCAFSSCAVGFVVGVLRTREHTFACIEPPMFLLPYLLLPFFMGPVKCVVGVVGSVA